MATLLIVGAFAAIPTMPAAGPDLQGVGTLAAATPVPTPPEPQLRCSVNVNPSQNLTAVVAAAAAASTFCLRRRHLQHHLARRPGLRWTGFLGSATNRPVINASATTIGIDARGAANVVLENIVVSGAQLQTGRNQCPACGRGVFAGDGIQLWNVELTGNAQNGLSGSQNTSTPWLIVDSQIIGNGDTAELGYAAGGIKGVNPYTILNSYVADNIGSGIWCDVGCLGGTWVVEGNTVVGDTRDGIRYEISESGATIEYNDVEGNNTSAGSFSGIHLASSGNANVGHNTSLANFGSQIKVENSGRQNSGVTNDSIIDNTVNGGKVVGCNISGVTCSGNI